VGNLLLGDEGLGVHVARALLAARASLPGGVEVREAGTSLFDLAGELSRFPRVVLVDAFSAGGEPGTVYQLEMNGSLLTEPSGGPPLSLHEWGVLDALRAMEVAGLLPARVSVIGAEPETIEPGLGLSPCLERAKERIVSILLEELTAPASEG